MQEIPRAILLPPPSSTAQRSSARATPAADQGLPAETGARRAANAAGGSFLTLVDTQSQDSVEFTADSRAAKQFRFRPYTNRGATTGREAEFDAIERPAADAQAAPEDEEAQAARDVLDGFARGDGSRNSAAFLASFIAQEQLSEGLHNPPHGGASDAYRRAGGSPPPIADRPRVVSFAA